MCNIQLESKTLRFTISNREKVPHGQLIDLTNGAEWGPVQLVQLNMYYRGVQRTMPTPKVVYEITQDGGSIRVQAAEPATFGLAAEVMFRMDGDSLVAEIDSSSLREDWPGSFRLSGIRVLPGILSVKSGENGHFVLPLRAGCLCRPQGRQKRSHSFLIYGDQKVWEDLPTLPMVGCVREKDENALLQVVESGECDAQGWVDFRGENDGETGLELRYIYTPIDPVDPIKRVTRFVPFRGRDAGFAGMGRYLHAWVDKLRGGRRVAEHPDVSYGARSITMKVNHGIKDGGHIRGDGSYTLNTTFARLCEQLDALKQAGVERVWSQSVGWNIDGHDGQYPTRFPVDERPGGEQAFRDMLAHGRKLGFMMGVHDNYLDSYKISPLWSEDTCIGDIYGEPLRQGIWSGGQNYRRWAAAIPDEHLRGEMERVYNLGVRGTYYIDAMGMPLEISYNKKHGEHLYRRACAEGINKILDTANEVYGSAGTECGFMYSAVHADYMASTFYREWAPHELCDVEVPLWCIVFRGHLFYDRDYVHMHVLDYPRFAKRSFRKYILELAESGSKPRLHNAGHFAAYNHDAPVEYYMDSIRWVYDLFCKRLEDAATAPITDYQILDSGDEPPQAARITETTYGDGTVVRCDFGKSELYINDEQVELPSDEKLPGYPPGTTMDDIS